MLNVIVFIYVAADRVFIINTNTVKHTHSVEV